ncbi:MAG: heavy metal translocating P-type ATPase [Oscillospiraceae bacterium]|jgi:Cd2+/Zn2+-exporting ATPase|nr:cadmium-translocating P-type ATPase [Firmicutes bacterium CAG:137]
MTKKQKSLLTRIILGIVLFLAGMILERAVDAPWAYWTAVGLLLMSWLLCGLEIAIKAVKNIGHGQIFDENFLMTLATVGAFALMDFDEGAAVMLFFQVGELFQSIAVERSRRSVAALMDLRPDVALVLRDGEPEECDPEEVEAGDLLRVLPGQRIPVDGVVVEGSSSVDTAKITGESVPADVTPGDRVLSGCINISGILTIRAESEYASSTVARILDLMESATEGKSATESLITRFARYYTPCVVAGAVILALLPPFFDGWQFAKWITRALNFLVVSCPCALVISVPLSFFGGMGAVSRAGMIAKGGVALENLAKAKVAVFDKTGTLTTGTFAVTQVRTAGMERDQLLRLVAGAESASSHPIARAIVAAADARETRVENLKEIPGRGISAVVEGHQVFAGNRLLMEESGFTPEEVQAGGTAVYAAVDGRYAGCILLEDTVKPGAREALAELDTLGIRETVMLTGDREHAAASVAKRLGLTRWFAGLLPQDKVERVRELQKSGDTLIFVGDGVNDAPVLALAGVGVAMGGIGSDAAVEASDLVLLKDDLRSLPKAIRISRKTMAVARQNIVFALAVKFIVLLLSIFGIATMWLAVFADVGVAVLAILNATRAGR